MAVITIELSDAAAARLSAAAANARVSEGEVVEAALGMTDAQAAAFQAFIARGEADIAAGRVASHEEVMAALRQRLAELRSADAGA